MIICVYQQLDISTNFKTNHAISNWINNATFKNDIRGEISLEQVKMKEDYYLWLESFINQNLYQTNVTAKDPMPKYRMQGVPGNNILISPIRLT